jgi:hypothetical protein
MPLLIDELDMRGAIASDRVGAAAALKMIRSVMIKGIEALTAECFPRRAARGHRGEVAASLHNNYPTLDWTKVIATTSNAWRATASAAPRRWSRSPPRCASSASRR